MSATKHEQVLREMFSIFTDFSATPDRLLDFMTADYRQFVDGHEMTLSDFQTHTQALRNTLSNLEIDIQHIVCAGEKAATVHVARATYLSGEQNLIKVVAFYQFRDGRICLVDELTHLLIGREKDPALGALQ
ncbi:nuclear transport factor 2 family protein [Acetobacter senegalensis]|uniref:nuclear transport factor 2 family protein n=1 Tax=Acetobacter senegalensis TaxID=446692 RepID=UPI001EDFDF7F|nr:nuclear transport factor 2 family protein [Acetobacter senegalensis]MCG4274619.1 nuclear transport factor 2 family protein [Acetobacter senegalensis]